MKKRLIPLLMMLACATTQVSAIPAYPGVVNARQADGSVVRLRIFGDEHCNWTVTADDEYPVVLNEATGNYEYAVLREGRVTASGVKVKNAEGLDATTRSFLLTVDKQRCAEAMREESAATNIPSASVCSERAGKRQLKPKYLINNFPHMGTPRSLVILVNFTDVKFSMYKNDPDYADKTAREFYSDMLNKEGFTSSFGATGSVADFYMASSDGAFKPQFDVYGPVEIEHSSTYYGQGMTMESPNSGDLLIEAVRACDDAIDFSQYDTDGDGVVDNVYFYYAGFGSADHKPANTIWPHANTLTEFGMTCVTNDNGVRVDSYSCSQEINGVYTDCCQGIGSFVHEFAHIIGLPDLYNTDGSTSTTDYTPMFWDTMAHGPYNNNSNTPPLFSAWERHELGWLDLLPIEDGSGDVETVITPLCTKPMGCVVSVPGTQGDEYFVLENRQRSGWDEYLPNDGLLVWHIDFNETKWILNAINNAPKHQNVDIVEACGYASRNALGKYVFPGPEHVTDFDITAWSGDVLFHADRIWQKQNDDIGLYVTLNTSGVGGTALTGDAHTARWFSLGGTLLPEGSRHSGLGISNTGVKVLKGNGGVR